MSDEKSRSKSRRPGQFTGKDDPRNGHGRGPRPGAPNAGRPKDVLRAKIREGLGKRLPFMFRVIDGQEGDIVTVKGEPLLGKDKKPVRSVSVSDRTRAYDILAKYGLGTQQEVEQDGEVTIHVKRDPDGAGSRTA